MIQYTPWGYAKVLSIGHNYKVKEIHIFPGERISLHYHDYRDEIWYIVEGKGIVTIKDKQFDAQYRKMFMIPSKAAHRAECTDGEELVIVEIQLGSCNSEEDIHRRADDFGRV